ncbi:hypothetical protein CHS0354_021662 [Potamilus streckersoni]|uniref:Uncharacterized protein n=1 Tax=Potamilus streckersoni TaxID=2493646 RepID=A0AAE0SQ42_9BIVA|nr:hypothetical protein CHS0354_021662 [Potamilus streckersoni]
MAQVQIGADDNIKGRGSNGGRMSIVNAQRTVIHIPRTGIIGMALFRDFLHRFRLPITITLGTFGIHYIWLRIQEIPYLVPPSEKETKLLGITVLKGDKQQEKETKQ